MTAKRAKRVKGANYSRIISALFLRHYKEGAVRIEFQRSEIDKIADELGIERPKNPGDVTYSFRYRKDLPASILAKVPAGQHWSILGIGKSKYAFVAGDDPRITPDALLVEIKIPDATPGVIAMYALSDEQSLLAKLRYNRLIDIFTGVTAYSLQNHLRTFVTATSQTETDEVYIGIDKRGAHYVFPVQAKGGKDRLGMTQVAQDIGMCKRKFPTLICRPICAQFMANDLIALFAFEEIAEGIRKVAERHFRLVPPDEVTTEDLREYKKLQE